MVCAVCNYLAPKYKIWGPVLFYGREKMYMNNNTKKITTTAMLAAIAYVVVVVGRIPVVLFLKYDPKDIIITLGGMIWGPLTSFIVSVIVLLIEMVTISENGILGCIMNIVSSCSFACTAAVIYKKKRTLKGAVTGLLAGSVAMVLVMMLWNYLIAPIYMGYPREAVAKLNFHLNERDRAEGLWAQPFRPVRYFFAVTVLYSFLLFLSAGISPRTWLCSRKIPTGRRASQTGSPARSAR
jgi:riboflavin transporter FmnP